MNFENFIQVEKEYHLSLIHISDRGDSERAVIQRSCYTYGKL